MEINRRELNKINSRKSILKASRKLFSEKGYEETMMEDIAEIAEVSKATIYNYFPNKESLLIGIAEEVLERADLLVNNQDSDFENSEEKLFYVIKEFVSASVDYLSLSRRISYLNSCEDNILYSTRKKMVGIIRNLVLEAQNEGAFINDASTDDIVDIIMGIYLIAQFEWSHIDEYSSEFLHEKLNRFYTKMLSAYRPRKFGG